MAAPADSPRSSDSSIKIPLDLLPEDGRFGAGPSKVRPEQVASLDLVSGTYLGTSHRQRPVKSQLARLRQGLAELFEIPDGFEVVLGNGGATAFWEMAVFGLIRDSAQFLSFGEFGSKFAKAAQLAPHVPHVDVRASDPGTAPSFAAVAGVDVYATPHNETSTGVAVTPARVPGADADALMLFDATSGAGGLPVDIGACDAYYFSPQKSFGSEGGLWAAIMSAPAIARARSIKESGRYIPAFLDLVTAIDNSAKDQTYNTPSLSTIWLMAEQVDWFLAHGGLAWSTGRSAQSASNLYGWAEASDYARPFVSQADLRSNVIGTIDLDDSIDAAMVAKVLRANGVVDTEPYRKLGRNQLRVAMFPAIDPTDVEALTRCIDHVVGRLH